PLITSAEKGDDQPQWLGGKSLPKWGLPGLPLKTSSLPNLFDSSTDLADDRRSLYTRAEQSFRHASTVQGEARIQAFRDAAELYEQVADGTTSTTLKEDAMYMVGECHFFADEYPHAVNAFDALIKLYPRTRHMDRVDKRRFAI